MYNAQWENAVNRLTWQEALDIYRGMTVNLDDPDYDAGERTLDGFNLYDLAADFVISDVCHDLGYTPDGIEDWLSHGSYDGTETSEFLAAQYKELTSE